MKNYLTKILKKCSPLNKENYNSDPIALLQKQPIEIEKGSFSPAWGKSGVSCSFILNNETFLAWAGSINSSGPIYHLIIYNLNRRERVTMHQSDRITLVSKFPNTTLECSSKKNWLYTASVEGIIRIYDISCQPRNKFKELYKITTWN